MDQIIKSLTAMVALSIGVERIVEIVKGAANANQHLTKQGVEPTPGRDAIIQSFAFVVGAVLAGLIGPKHFLPIALGEGVPCVAAVIVIGAFASGGSGFWNQLLGIVLAVRQVRDETLAEVRKAAASVRPHPEDATAPSARADDGTRTRARAESFLALDELPPRPSVAGLLITRLRRAPGVVTPPSALTAEEIEVGLDLAGRPDSPLNRVDYEALPPVPQPRAGGTLNWSGDYHLEHSSVVNWMAAPGELEVLSHHVKAAATAGRTVRTVGTLHSTSDVLRTSPSTTLIQAVRPGSATLPLRNDSTTFIPFDGGALVRVRAAATIGTAARDLWRAGYAFTNQGGFSGQTVGGAMSCSTHGSGITLGPLSDSALAFDFLGASGQVTRIQAPAVDHALTERHFRDAYGAFAGDWISAEDAIQHARVSMGEFGVMHSVVARVDERYKLSETKTLADWELIQADLEGLHAQTRHLEIWIAPYAKVVTGRHRCVVVTRHQVSVEADDESAGYRDLASGRTSPQEQRTLAHHAYTWHPALIGAIVEGQLSQLPLEGRVAQPDAVFDIGDANQFSASSVEYVVPLEKAVELVDALLARIASNVDKWLTHSGWVSLRFVAGTRSTLSMFNGPGPFCTLELPLINGADPRHHAQVERTLRSYQAVALAHGARPHWAQSWWLKDNELQTLLTSYPGYAQWRGLQQRVGGEVFRTGRFP